MCVSSTYRIGHPRRWARSTQTSGATDAVGGGESDQDLLNRTAQRPRHLRSPAEPHDEVGPPVDDVEPGGKLRTQRRDFNGLIQKRRPDTECGRLQREALIRCLPAERRGMGRLSFAMRDTI